MYNVKFYEKSGKIALTFRSDFIKINTMKDVKKRRKTTSAVLYLRALFCADKGIICMGGVPENIMKRMKNMRTNDKKNTSAKKKLIPAVAMLTTSAVMLSTATYAWFTLNTTAEVTGLNMTATAGGSIEISLGATNNGVPAATEGGVTTPSMTNKSWKKTIAVSEYYSKIGKLKPASTIDAKTLYVVDDGSVYAGGRAVDDTAAEVTVANDGVTLTLADSANNTVLANDNTTGTDGNYVDIPVWIRTSQKKAQTVSCNVTIKNPTSDMTGSATVSDLQKAVRVAIIPQTAVKESFGSDTGTATNALSSTYSAAGNMNVFATDYTSYTKSGDANTGISAIKTKDTGSYATNLKKTEFTSNTAKTGNTTSDASVTATNIFDLDAATDTQYSVEPFVVRVWLEGESTSCQDINASQDWDIQLDFTATEKNT